MESKICPICGIGELIRKEEKEVVNDLFAGEYTITRVYYICPVCGEEGDFFNENENAVSEIEKNLKKTSIKNIIDHLEKMGHRLAGIERSLELPQRTLSKWKNEHIEASAAGVSLLKYIYIYPWLLELADKNFDPQEAQMLLWRESFKELFGHGESIRRMAATVHNQSNFSAIAIIAEHKHQNNISTSDKVLSVGA